MKPVKRRAAQMTHTDAFFIAPTTALKLLAFCRANGWSGHDPYDALNGRTLRLIPLLNCRVGRLLVTQIVRRCPVNLRPLLRVPKTLNPKGAALLLSSLIRLAEAGTIEPDSTIRSLMGRLVEARSPIGGGVAWGYNFDWQTRSYLVPKGSPNIICSSFAANALMDVYEFAKDPECLSIATKTAEFLQESLLWRESSFACFSYTPIERTRIHNANLLGAALLCRVGKASGRRTFTETGLAAARYSAASQRENGSWPYGELPSQRWIDNFHTGFNLVALRQIGRNASTTEFEPVIRRGFSFYRAHFFEPSGIARYYHDSTYPVDIHSVAQSLITLWEYQDMDAQGRDLALSVFGWAMNNMWDARGFFYYQRKRYCTVRTPFMRWSQAWMLLALATLLSEK